jgi:hypothetical protein
MVKRDEAFLSLVVDTSEDALALPQASALYYLASLSQRGVWNYDPATKMNFKLHTADDQSCRCSGYVCGC